MTRTNEADVVVLGAGVAGLSAAVELSQSKQVIVLEARDRVGGRIFSRLDPDSPVPVELGAEFVHGHMPDTFDLLMGAKLVAYDLADSFVTVRNGKIVPQDQAWEAADEFIGELRKLKKDVTFAEHLAKHGKKLTPEARRVAIDYVEGFNAADHRLVSCVSLAKAAAEEEKYPEGHTQYRLTGPYSRLADHLASLIKESSRIVLKAQVMAVRWGDGRVEVDAEVEGQRQTFIAKACVIALPLGVLQGDVITFEPELPTREALRNGLTMGDVAKVVVRFDEPFWERLGHRDLSFIHEESAPLPTWWTALPLRTPVLVGWAGGPKAQLLIGAGPEKIREAVEVSLSKLFAKPRRTLAKHIVKIDHHDWRADEFSNGAYSYAKAGYADLPKQLAKPVANTLFMAGEHTHEGELGTVASAIHTGKRAAQALLRGEKKPRRRSP